MNGQEKRLTAEVSFLYYVKDFSQKQIADELNVNRATVSRLLKKARREKIITFKINNYDIEVFSLANQIKEKYHLKKVIIVPDEATLSATEQAVAEAANHYLSKIIHQNEIVGFSWGNLLSLMTNGKKSSVALNATFIPLAGGPSLNKSGYHVNSIVYGMAQKYNSKSLFINAATIQENSFKAQAVWKTEEMKKIQMYWQKQQIAVVGIGGSLSEKSLWRDQLSDHDWQILRSQKVVGDCCCTFFNKNGQIVDPDLLKRTIAFPLNDLKKVKQTIGVAANPNKALAISTLIKHGIINILVIDKKTARAILMKGCD